MDSFVSMGRRGFLLKAAAFAAAAPLARAQRAVPPSGTVTMGVVGYGGRGRQMMPIFMHQQGVRVLAVCDAMKDRREQMKKDVDAFCNNSDCTAYRDFREMFARQDIDALYIATGDRWHAQLAIQAMQSGKDVYCEKPISLSIREGAAVLATARRYQRIYQGGVQRRTVGNFITAMNLAKSGRLGRLHTLHAGMVNMGHSSKNSFLPDEALPDPGAVDWDMWLGPAPWRPFNAKYLSGGWHAQYDFHGDLTEWGSHTVDLCQYMLGRTRGIPTAYEKTGPKRLEAAFDDGVKIVFREEGFKSSCAVRFEGDEGWVETDDSGDVAVSAPNLLEGRKIQAERWERPVAHPAEFLASVRSRRIPTAPAEDIHFPHVTCHAATVAFHLGRKLTFDPATLTFTGDAEASRRLLRPHRLPWVV
ncbi:MAG: Gfo/Idh/MocA family oxidoreductase [Kiritimatiellaeota bacterium]|nr:Gfo/Idh/MocA family oxidoreductase [Kiritimatiellota bacterium]